MTDAFPEIKSTHSLVAKWVYYHILTSNPFYTTNFCYFRYVTKPIWEKLSSAVTKTSGFTLAQAIACAVEFDNQHCGIYAGDWDSYKVRH